MVFVILILLVMNASPRHGPHALMTHQTTKRSHSESFSNSEIQAFRVPILLASGTSLESWTAPPALQLLQTGVRRVKHR